MLERKGAKQSYKSEPLRCSRFEHSTGSLDLNLITLFRVMQTVVS